MVNCILTLITTNIILLAGIIVIQLAILFIMIIKDVQNVQKDIKIEKQMEDYNEITDINKDTENKDKVCFTKSDFAEMMMAIRDCVLLDILIIGCYSALVKVFSIFC